MRRLKNPWLGWIGVLALLLGMQFAVHRDLPTGEPPMLAGQTLDGAGFDLSHLRGQPAVIYFWASWCPICRGMQDNVRAVAQGHPVISVAMQSGNRAELAEYVRQHDFPVPTLPDEDGSIAGRFGLRGVPVVFILDPAGQIRYATAGYTSEVGLRVRLWLAGR